MPEKEENLSLANIGTGAAVEMFDEELKNVLRNIADVNTPWKDSRTVTLTVTFHPNEDRDKSEIEVKCKSSLAAPKAFPTTAFICAVPGGHVAVEAQKPKQTSLFDKAPHDNVRPIGERG